MDGNFPALFLIRPPYRLAVDHPSGELVEYFDSAIAALVRQSEIEEVLLAERAQLDQHTVISVSARVGVC